MLEVKDEILNGEPKYRLKDENGNIIYDNLSIEQITPVIQEGTPINKVLFDSIQNSLNFNAENTQDVMRYIVCASNIKPLTYYEDLLAGTWTQPSKESTYNATNGTASITVKNRYNSDYPAIKAVDNDETTYWRTTLNYTSSNCVMQIDFGKKVVLKKLKARISNFNSSSGFSVYSGDSKGALTNLLYTGAYQSAMTEITLENTTLNRYYTIVDNTPDEKATSMAIYELETISYEAETNCLELKTDNVTEYRKNMTVKIIIPTLDASHRTFLNINELGYKEVVGVTKPGYYTLVYDGTNFVTSTELDEPRINKSLSIKTGTVTHNAVIPKTSGYTNYMYFVSTNYAASDDLSCYTTTVNDFKLQCSVVQSTRTVTCGFYENDSNWVLMASGTANYIEIAWN